MQDSSSKEKTDPNIKNSASKFSYICFDFLESIVHAIILIVVLMLFFIRIVNVSGSSMEQTLFNGDKVVVVKWRYKPKNGDVVVISKGQNLDEPLIKRVIATEGDTLSINFDKGSVAVNGITLNETYIKEPMWLQGDGDIPSVVPKGYAFAMGDNRNHSMDSRFKDVGLIDNENIVGKASFIVFPFDRFGVIR